MSDTARAKTREGRRSIHVEVPRHIAKQVRMAAVARDVPLHVVVTEALCAAGYDAEPTETTK
jgi:hypothetical protein